jgi:Icc protein
MDTLTRLKTRPMRLIQITDCHLGSTAGETLLGLNTDESLVDVLELVRASEPRTDLVVASGDISNDGGTPSYDRFIARVNQCLPHTPLAWLEGNHDDPEGMRAILSSRPHEHDLLIGGWHIILMNTRIPGAEGGALEASELQRLEKLLAAQPDTPTMIFMHHQPIPVGSAWVDQYVVTNADAFFAVVDRHSQVKAIAWGHVHQDFYTLRKGVKLFATPSTCVQFAPRSDEFKVDTVMPGYRWFNLHADGRIDSEVVRVAERSYGTDFASAGY